MSEDRSLEWVEYTKVDGEVTRAKERVVTEFALSIFINGKQFATAMITPMMEKEFIVGHLFGQGIIENIADIESITVKDNIAEASQPALKPLYLKKELETPIVEQWVGYPGVTLTDLI